MTLGLAAEAEDDDDDKDETLGNLGPAFDAAVTTVSTDDKDI